MKKGIFILTLLILALFSVSCIYAADVNDTLAANEDTGVIELSHEIESADNNLGTSEEQKVTQTDNEEKTGATDDGTFEALTIKIDSASSGDTVYLENNYSCEDSRIQYTGIPITASNLVIDGQGHTIDAKQKTRIFHIYQAENVTIKNIKFINAKINSQNGGAILWYEGANGSVSGCSFVNCSAEYDGGAIEWSHSGYGSVSGCSFVNCSAAAGSGGAIDWYMSANGNISDCAFINNTASEGRAIYISRSSASLDRNWFGNTAENYKTSPNAYIDGASTDSWLFLNATVNPESISIAETADLIFKLYLYNGSISDYTSLAKVDLTLNSNGKLDKNVTGLDEKVTFTPTSLGTGSVTATIGDVAYTTTLTVPTDGTTFWDLNNIINGNTNDTITLDKDYSFNPAYDSAFTEGIRINRPVTINGNSYTIDAKGQARILNVGGDNVTINNVTFVNGKRDGGGAIYWYGDNGAVSGSSFTGNHANWNGGAIYWKGDNGAVSGSSFTGNNAIADGGAIYWKGDNGAVSGSSFTGNNAIADGGAILWSGANGAVSDCIFLNNTAGAWGVIYAYYNDLNMNHCWFGNTADNYDSSPAIGGYSSYDNWLFLNATANPNEVPAFSTSEIVFKLYLYNKTPTTGNISEYDNTLLLPINLTITSTNGDVDIHTANFGDSIRYTATSRGTGSITSSIENVKYTIETTNLGLNPDLSVDSQEADYSNRTIIAINYNSSATGTVNITLKGKNGNNYTFTNFALNATILLPEVINADEYEVNVTYSGDNVFLNATATGKLTINKANSTLTINDNVTFDYNTNGSTTVSYANASGVNASVVGQPNAIVVVNDTTITVSGLNAGNYTLTVTTIPDDDHNSATKTVNITVNKAGTKITLTNETLYLKAGDMVSDIANLTPTDAGNLTFQSSNEDIAIAYEGTIWARVKGNVTVTVSFAGNDNYAPAANKTITVYITPKDANVSVENETLNLNVDDKYEFNPTVNPSFLAVQYSSSNVSVVTVTDYGLVRAVGEGTAIITLTVGNDQTYAINTTNVTVTVSKVPTEISLANATVDLHVLDEIGSGATLTPADAGNLTYTSGNESVAIVKDGKIIAVGAGKAVITVSFAGDDKYAKADDKTVTVTVNLKNASVSVNNSTLDLFVGDNFTIVATTAPAGLNVTYVPVDSGVYIVDDKGVVTALKNGTGKILVKVGDGKVYAENSTTVTVTVSKVPTEIVSSAVTTVYNSPKNLIVTLNDAYGKPIRGANITVDLNGAKTYTTDENGQVKVSTKGLAPKTYTANIIFNGNDKYKQSTKDVKVTVKKATPKITANTKTFKTTTKTKKYTITLKDNTGKPIKKVTVYLKVGGKTYKATTNSKGKATFKITKLNNKGTYKATVTYKGNKYYNKATKKVTIKVKSVWKTVSKGSKNSAIVKKIQRALKNHGYYLEYNGRYLMVDGIYWDYTEMAVKEFQKDKVLKVTGKVDEKTAKKLGII